MSAPVENDPAEKSVSAAQFRAILSSGWPKIRIISHFMGSFPKGSRYLVIDQYHDAQFYIVTDSDWTTPLRFTSSTAKIERMGSANAAFGVNAAFITVTVSLSPVLPDSTLTNYKVFASVNDVLAIGNGARPYMGPVQLQDTATLKLEARRSFTGTGLATPTSTGTSTVTASPLTAVSQPVAQTHGDVISGFDHTHDTAGLHTATVTVTNNPHSHLASLSGAAITVNVDWMIVHI